MAKKIKVTLSRSMLQTIENDMEDFKVSKDYFMNYLFYNLKDEEIFPFNDLTIPEVLTENDTMQFNLNKTNSSIYYDILKKNNAMNESKFFRTLIKKYASNSKNSREIFIFKESVERILLAIEDKKNIEITFKDGKKVKVSPYLIASGGLEIANYIFCYNIKDKTYKNYKLINIDSVKTLNETACWEEIDYINYVRENFNPFITDGQKIKVEFTEEGLKLLKRLKTFRPNILEELDSNTIIFECSDIQAIRYFSSFIENAIILEPEHLRENLLARYQKAVKNLKNKGLLQQQRTFCYLL